jgi:hypothetical protein
MPALRNATMSGPCHNRAMSRMILRFTRALFRACIAPIAQLFRHGVLILQNW